MLFVRELYGMKSSEESFRDLLDKQVHGLGYRTLIADTEVWMILAVKPGGFIYYAYVL